MEGKTPTDTCYHIMKDANGNLYEHKHEDSGYEEDIDEDGDGKVDLKEDKQCVYLPFNQLFQGNGWGVKNIPVYNGEDYAFEGITILDRDVADSVEKFELQTDISAGEQFDTGITVTIGDLFAAKDNADVAIDTDNVQVFVTPADDNSTVSAVYTPNTTDWTQGTVTFSGHGAAEIIISDYYYCIPTSLIVNIQPTVTLELESHVDNLYDDKQSQITKVYVQLDATGELPLASTDVTLTVPADWTLEAGSQGTLENGTWTYTAGKTTAEAGGNLLATFVAGADYEVSAEDVTVNTYAVTVQGKKTAVDANLKNTTFAEGHEAGEWIAWGDDASEEGKPIKSD